ncbi:hypothetical protein LTR74_004274 [Friedmanniomyces endolithicus]|nr:hypothetical protein LTR74_004274 [Friedmanniomyces endolithicus]
MSNYGMKSGAHLAPGGGTSPYRFREPNYQSYRSPYGPQYKVGAHMGIMNRTSLQAWYVREPHSESTFAARERMGTMGIGFGAVAGIFALFFFDGVPKVQKDILQKIPIIGDFYVHEVPPEDNPF